eukprot:10862276-Alexandrium_andersonii.AAC.1
MAELIRLFEEQWCFNAMRLGMLHMDVEARDFRYSRTGVFLSIFPSGSDTSGRLCGAHRVNMPWASQGASCFCLINTPNTSGRLAPKSWALQNPRARHIIGRMSESVSYTHLTLPTICSV